MSANRTGKYQLNTPCKLWTKGLNRPGGYGRTYRGGGSILVHRLAWEEAHGPIPAGMSVCHKCDVPACFNVDHLFLGTHKENMEDRERKGRGKVPRLRGDDHPARKRKLERERGTTHR